jgi:predicted amidohydrolase YtcJ
MIRRAFIACVAIFSVSAVQAQTALGDGGADLIVVNAKIYTGDQAKPEASALAVKKGRIYSVGSDAEIFGLKSASTKVIDARSRRIIPGVIDAHIHVLNDLAYTYNVRWDGVPTLNRALTMLTEQAKRTPEGQWVKVIGGWSPYQFKENRFPTLDELQKAAPDRPLIVQYAYNRAYLNKPAMKALGLGSDRFPNVPGTEIEKDSSGNPTGLIHGNTWLFIALEIAVPQPTLRRAGQLAGLQHPWPKPVRRDVDHR